MKIAFNPSTVAALIAPPNNKDITFDLRGHNIFARGVKFCGTDTNTWRDIKINNVSIDSNILDLRDGDNTTLTNINGIVTINSTWRPVVDNLTSDSTTSSLSANLGRILKALIDGKSDSGHIHDDRYLKLTGGIMQLGEGLKFHADNNYFGTDEDARIISLLDGNDKICDGGLIIDERATYNGTEYVTELLRIRDSEFKWKGLNILHSGNYNYYSPTLTGIGATGTWNINISGNAATATLAHYLTVQYCRDDNYPSNKGLWNTIKNGTTNTINNRVRFYTIYGSSGDLGAPETYGELLEICSYNSNHWQPLLWFGAGTGGRLYYRNKDYNNDSWGAWRTVAWTSDIPTVTDYYWANIKVSTSSNTITTPTFGKLYISGEYPHIDMTSTSAESSIYFRPSSGTSWAIGKAPWGVGGFGIGILSDGSKLTILDNGNVGIGTTSPLYKLDVAGNIRMSSHLYASTANMTGAILKVYDEGNNYGLKVVLGSGGTTLIGAGESADVLANYYTDENLYLSADGDVNIFTHLDGGWDSRKHAACFSNNGNTYIYGGLHIGSSSSNNYIAFYGNTGDDPGYYQTSFIGEHLWGSPESTELLLMKFNDVGNGIDGITPSGPGPDRIRHLAHAHVFQIMTDTSQGDFITMANSSAVETKFDIARYQLHAYAPLAIISDGTNSGYDGLVYMRHYSNNDWGLIVDKSQSYTYGVDIRAGGDYALKVGNGNTRLIGATIIGADATPSYTLDVRGNIRATENLIVSTNNTTGGGIIFADDGDIVDLNDAYCTMRFTSGIRITNANRGGSVVHELNVNGKLYNYGLYHHSYGSYDYLLTSNGDARHINSLPYAPLKELWIDMTGYSESYWHPVVTSLPYSGYRRIKVTVQLNSGTKPSWSTHESGFTCNLDLWVTAHGWGTTSSETICLNSTYAFADQNPVGWCQLGNSSHGILLLRGGGRYLVCTDWDTSWTIHNQSITDYAGTPDEQTCGPYTSWPGIFNGSTNKNWIYAHTRGNIITDDWLSIRDYAGSYHGRSNNISGYAGEIWFGGNFHIDSQNSQNLYLNYYTSAIVSIAQGGGNVGIGTDSPSYKLDVRGTTRSTDRIYANEWIQFDNWTGLYSPNNNAHFYPNNTTSYGQWQLRGNKNGYSGIHFGDSTHYMTIMDNYLDKGVYQEDWNWLWYFNARNGKFSIRTSSDFGADINLNGSVRTNSTYYGYGLYHLSYGSSAYALTSDGGATHIGSMSVNYANYSEYSTRLDGGAIAGWGTLTSSNGFSGIAAYDWGDKGAFCWAGKGGQMYMQVDGWFYLNEGQYRVLDTSDAGSLSVNYANYAGYLTAYTSSTTGIGSNMLYLWYDWNNTGSLGSYFHGIWVGSPDSNIGYDLAYLHDDHTHLYMRSYDYGSWNSWYKICTNADTYVTSDGTNRGIINGSEVASTRHLLINGTTWNSDWHWSGQGGQPSWLWGSNDGTNMYVWDPSNFSVASATKLQTPRTIWGQSFDGTADVNGTIYINNSDSSNGAIRLNNNVNSNARISAISDQVIFNTGNAIRFGETDWDWNQWAGLKYNHSNKTIYLGIADGSIFNANSTLSDGTLNLRAGISNIDLNSGTSIRGLPTDGSPYSSSITLRDTSISLSAYEDISMSTGPGAIELTSGYSGIKLSCLGNNASIGSDIKIESSRGVYLNSGSGNVYLCLGGGKVGIGTTTPTLKLDVIGNIRATGQIIREGSGLTWVNGRNGALLRETSVAGYHTLWSLKTTDGSWDFGEYNAGSDWNNIPVLSYITDSNYNSGNNTPTYQIRFPLASGTVALTSNIPNPTNYYWANVKISTSSSTTTSPTVSNLTATSSIRMGNISLEHTDEINNITNGNIYLNFRNSGNVSLCYGGGKVGIGTATPLYELDVMGNTFTAGFGIRPYYLSNSGLLSTISPGDGYTYRCLEIGKSVAISCIIADRVALSNERGVLIKFNTGFDGLIVLLKDLLNYGDINGNGYFWVMPSGCKIIKPDGSSTLISYNLISNAYDDGKSRFFVYSYKYDAWIEFYCG